MKDLEIHLNNHPGALATMGEILASEGISIEGGGVWLQADKGIAHFLFKDAEKAREVLESHGIKVVRENEILIQKLKQDIPGQLGKFTRLLARKNINIEVQYSDHYNRLILVVDDYAKGKELSRKWSEEQCKS